ncbi:hypothetical protein [Wielerella bovis]|uniref:hypothetical protein n=1 Tax=Wielerella bovis TaxID=2917790 RepID=UPI002018AE74|nr:hypothetical protein [Wielerella bovis]ULJ60308.1 hypothetical protein MIS44_11845 [Wielerella bovis]
MALPTPLCIVCTRRALLPCTAFSFLRLYFSGCLRVRDKKYFRRSGIHARHESRRIVSGMNARPTNYCRVLKGCLKILLCTN